MNSVINNNKQVEFLFPYRLYAATDYSATTIVFALLLVKRPFVFLPGVAAQIICARS